MEPGPAGKRGALAALALVALVAAVHCAGAGRGGGLVHAPVTPSARLAVVFDAPEPGFTMVDVATFRFHLTGPEDEVAAVAAVELRMSGLPIDQVPMARSGADGQAPVAARTGSVTTSAAGVLFDGDYSAQWVAKGRNGAELGRSARLPVIVRQLTGANAPGVTAAYSLPPGAPADGATVSGVATVALFSASWAGPNLDPAGHDIYEYFVDGEMAGPGMNWGPQGGLVGWSLDTTRWPNGVHAVYVQAEREGANPDVFYYAVRRELDFQNGAAPMALVPAFAEVDLHPGESLPLGFREVFTDGTSAPVDPATLSVASGDTLNAPIVVASSGAPGADAGAVAYSGALSAPAGAHGTASLTFTSASLRMAATVRVYVAADLHVPHLSRTGQTLRRYDPAQSVFVRTYFGSGAKAKEAQRADQAAQYRAAGINTVTQGFYANPADSRAFAPGAEPEEAWHRWPSTDHSWSVQFDRTVDEAYDWVNAGGFLLLLTGDDLLRTPAERTDTAQNPWASRAVAYALQKAMSRGGVVGIEMVDEANLILGGRPPPVAFQVQGMVNAVPGRPSVGWPLLGSASGEAVAAWQGEPGLSDHLTYYSTGWDRRGAYRFGPGIGQAERYALTQPGASLYGRWPYVQRTVDEPFFLLTGCGVADPYALWEGHILALAEIDGAAVMAAAAVGAAGVRVFQLDNAGNKRERAAARAAKEAGKQPWPKTSGVYADPWSVGTDRWASIGASFNLIAKLEADLLGERISAVALPGNFVVGARRSPGSRLYMAVNVSEEPSKQLVDLSAYLPERVQSITRYRQKGDGQLVTEALPATTRADAVTFDAAESIVWVVR